MRRLVLDTNVVLDLLHWQDPVALPILEALRSERAECLADTATLGELQRVLAYPGFALAPAAREAIYMAYDRLARRVETGAPQPLPRCRDTDDQKFLELAARSGAELLVSKDKALLRLRGRTRLPFAIVAPAAAAALLQF
jgi:putative PIN family toxin of toxin-antitoxin system